MPDKTINSPKFEVRLSGLDLSEKQVANLEAMLKETTMKFLGKLDSKGNLVKGMLELTPDPDYWPPRPWPPYGPFPPRPFPGFYVIIPDHLGNLKLDIGRLRYNIGKFAQ